MFFFWYVIHSLTPVVARNKILFVVSRDIRGIWYHPMNLPDTSHTQGYHENSIRGANKFLITCVIR
jgi:hypothetical protein